MRTQRWRGVVTAEIYAAFPERILNACAAEGIKLLGLTRKDACTLCVSIQEAQLPRLSLLTERQHAELRIVARVGGSRLRAGLRRRAVLLFSLAAAFALLLLSGAFLWEIEVRGCETLTEGQVLRALADCGVYEGRFWPGLSQDEVRSQMLLRLPELGWMTVNVSGSRAIVSVVERTERPEIYVESDACDLIASTSGIVTELCVLNGRPLVQIGDAVVAGETLVTGAMDSLSRPTRRVRAAGTVMADTWFEQTATIPEMTEKTHLRSTHRRFALLLGKKRVNFYLGSRKELDGYDKIVHEYKLGIKGLFSFPLTLVCETYRSYARGETAQPDAEACALRLRQSLEEQIEGEILKFHTAVGRRRDLPCVTARAHCRENIAETAAFPP